MATPYFVETLGKNHILLNCNSYPSPHISNYYIFILPCKGGFKLVERVQTTFQWLSTVSEHKKKRLPASYRIYRKPLFQAFFTYSLEMDCIKMRFYISSYSMICALSPSSRNMAMYSLHIMSWFSTLSPLPVHLDFLL